MNIEKLETIEGKVCTKCGVWKPLEEYHKKKSGKDGRQPRCKECRKEQSKYYSKQHYEANKEWYKEYNKQWYEKNKDKVREQHKQWREQNGEYNKQHYEANKEKIKEQNKQYREVNKNRIKEYDKQRYEINKKYNLEQIKQLLIELKPVFKNLSVYGYIYKIENVKTGHVYIGQTIKTLKQRYRGNIINGWIEERKKKVNQKFLEELIEEDFKVTKVLDVGCCQYHLDKLETYWINYYNSYNNGYNNQEGNHNTDDGIEEFNQILSDHNLEFKDGKLIQIKAPTQDR